jgi:hypothetical protein
MDAMQSITVGSDYFSFFPICLMLCFFVEDMVICYEFLDKLICPNNLDEKKPLQESSLAAAITFVSWVNITEKSVSTSDI